MQRVMQKRTFIHQSKLPRLPVPALQDTLAVYLKSVKPLLSPENFKQTEKVVNEFQKPAGFGNKLQQRLVEYEAKQPYSWLEEWWLKMAYHSWREPSMINSNWYLVMKDHPNSPSFVPNLSGITDFQINRAAGIISNMLNFQDLVDTEQLEPEMTKSGPICMNQWKQMFGVTRVPQEGCDKNVGNHPAFARHIIVLIGDQAFAVQVLDPSGDRVQVSEIQKQLHDTVSLFKSSKKQPEICLLTSGHRDKWCKTYKHLRELSPINNSNFDLIESSLFVISLDDYSVGPTLNDHTRNVFHGKGGHNRWFDKALNVIFDNNGRSGVNGEHSPLDAVVPAMMIDHSFSNEPAVDPVDATKAKLSPPQLLEWTVDDLVMKDITIAQKDADALIADSDLTVLHFKDFGLDFIKKVGKVSPDAFVQMAIQLAYFKIHGKFAPVYESSSTRQFLHGRTETCRSCSVDSTAFLKVCVDKTLSNAEKYKYLQKACKSHVDYITAASNGRGCDRHMLGLRMVIKPDEPTPAIFTDPAYRESMSFRLSTSGLFTSKCIVATGFGAGVNDGYGMNYQMQKDMILVGLESKVSNKETSTEKFKNSLADSLNELRAICQDVNDPVKSKL